MRELPLNADYQDAVDRFVVPGDHHDREAQKWLAAFLKRMDWSSLRSPSLWGFTSDEPQALPPRLQIALLKWCIELMSWLREQSERFSSPDSKEWKINFDIGGVVYSLANDLFRRPLPFSEQDICHILETTRHDCGHGGDVTAPFDVALEYARRRQLSTRLLKAIKSYVGRMKSLRSNRVQDVKRKAELLLTVDATYGKKRCWSERFREGMSDLSESQQKKWRATVVHMEALEFARNRKNWKAKAPQIIESLGVEHILSCLSIWLPSPVHTPVCRLETGGSYVLQHFVWLLEVIAQDDRHATRCDSLVVQFSKLVWKPQERGQKVMVAVAHYLEDRPPAVAWVALQRLNAWSESIDKKKGYTGKSIFNAVTSYAEKYRLSPGMELAPGEHRQANWLY